MASVLDKQVVFVTGKGGVGRSTVAAALGLAAVDRGKRTLLVEVAEQERLARALGAAEVGGTETEVADGLWAVSIEMRRALEEWLRRQLGSGTLSRFLNSSSAFQYFVAAVPGGAEVITMGKVWDLAQAERWDGSRSPYDLIVVDAPASGHGLAMLRAPRTFAEIARVGPIHRQAEKIWDLVCDRRRTGFLAVALPEEMPVTETLEFERRVHEDLGTEYDAIVANAVLPRRFSGADARDLRAALDDGAGEGESAVRAALAEHGRAAAQHSQLARLRRGARAPVVTLPFLFAPELDRSSLARLARELERKLSEG